MMKLKNFMVFITGKELIGDEGPIYQDILEELKSNKKSDSYDHLNRNPTKGISPNYQAIDRLF